MNNKSNFYQDLTQIWDPLSEDDEIDWEILKMPKIAKIRVERSVRPVAILIFLERPSIIGKRDITHITFLL